MSHFLKVRNIGQCKNESYHVNLHEKLYTRQGNKSSTKSAKKFFSTRCLLQEKHSFFPRHYLNRDYINRAGKIARREWLRFSLKMKALPYLGHFSSNTTDLIEAVFDTYKK